ncbi:MAG: hypothetical protein A2Z45_10150 [Chloroflexi bacterium RBG_19FT_COMBO_55_16]|nr:MAG: hypothetical protein A2Z45_10150 [Chloroflexi bacterium RBG_19FT_COMBO_55_16]
MRTSTGRVTEIRLDQGQAIAWIACPGRAIPAPGQYLLASPATAILSTPLYCAQPGERGFLAAPPIPASFVPGTALDLRGPLGRGFRLPEEARHLALVAAGDSIARLLPLAAAALLKETAVTLFSDAPLPNLPSSLEAYPLSALPDLISWADFLAIDLSHERLPGLRQILGLAEHSFPPCPGQVLILAPMPCGNLAGCGVCAVPTRRGYKLACVDGPVFELKDLMV